MVVLQDYDGYSHALYYGVVLRVRVIHGVQYPTTGLVGAATDYDGYSHTGYYRIDWW